MQQKVWRGLALALTLAVTATACTAAGSGDGAASGSAGPPQRGGTLHVTRSESFDGWDQDKASAYASYQTLDAVLEPMVRSAANGKELEPGIATSWTYDPAKLAWTFVLRDGVTFSDGQPLTSADVAFSEGVWASGANFGSLYSGIKKVETPDAKTVVFDMATPFTTLPILMSWSSSGIMPKGYGGKTKKEFDTNPIGAGAFTVTSWSPGGTIVLARNPHYYLTGRPYVDQVQIDVVADGNERAVLFQSGQTDISEYVSLNTAKQYGTSTVALPASQVEHLSLNTTKAPFDNIDVRQAIASAIDYNAIAQGPAKSYGSAPNGILPPNLGHWAAPSQQAFNLNLDKARQLIASSGAKVDRPFEIVYDSGIGLDELIAQIVQSNLAEIGVTVKLTGLETGAFLDRAYGLSADMVLWSYGAISPDMVDPMGWILGTSWLFTGFETKTIGAQYAAYNAATSDQAKQKIVTQVQDDAIKNAQAIPLLDYQVLQAVNSRVQGFASAPWGLYYWDPIWIKG